MKKVRYGILGASGIAQRRVLPAFQNCTHSELAAICSRSPESAHKLAEKFQAPRAFGDLDAMLREVDAVYIATPIHCHLPQAIKVLAAGRHLLIEKPLALNPAEATVLLAKLQESNALAMEAYMMKFHPAHGAIREAIQAHRIGRIVYARARLGCWYPDLPDAWRQNPKLGGGGALMDLGSHLIDLLVWMLGPIDSVRALCSTQIFRYPVEDSATVLLKFQEGAHATTEAYFSFPDQVGEGVLEIVGTQGRILAEGTIGQNGAGRVHWEFFPRQKDYDAQQDGAETFARRTEEFPPFDLYAAQLDYFSTCILHNRTPILNGLAEGAEILKWISRAYESSRRN